MSSRLRNPELPDPPKQKLRKTFRNSFFLSKVFAQISTFNTGLAKEGNALLTREHVVSESLEELFGIQDRIRKRAS
ncbi:hypothetical protein PCASD_13413 [Puccinia coronata f. sp. avenae]|uniref:Uncharacterized protein n=1 Tax=Puccinia coronata f. sp. avenae TaxID=200324 RepID=A0A2N5T0R0_9BASI|nr:hypothetical protein PCASD_13413 [Puccinia coronata f. sp. avenae]